MSRIALPRVANFFAYFDPKERIGSRDILFLICSPAHRSKDVKQELGKAGLTPREATSRREMTPGLDKAFVFVSGGINFASSDDMAGAFYLGLVQILSKRKKRFNAVVSKVILGKTFWFLLHHPCGICLKCLGARFHCIRSFVFC